MKIQIKPEYLNNDFYTITPINQQQVQVFCSDFQLSPTSTSIISFTPTSKIVNANKKLMISIPSYTNLIDIDYIKEVFFIIKNEINKDFFKEITMLGEQHRNNQELKFDVIPLDIKKDSIYLGDGIYNRLNNACNYLASKNGIGPAEWLISNGKTYNHLLSFMLNMNLVYNKNGQLMINNKPFFIDESITDDILLIGRKNTVNQPGVHCYILTDSNDNILFNEIISSGMNKSLLMYYAMEDIGSHSYLQYFKINTTNLAYQRYKKIKKIELNI